MKNLDAEEKIPSIGDKVFAIAKEFQHLASNQASGNISTRELVQGISELGRTAQYWHGKAEKLAMRELWRESGDHTRDKFFEAVLQFPSSAV